MGAATLHLSFDGVLNDKLRGWYRSTYVDEDGREQVIATSQMQATDCRRAFPCWDEPDFKAIFGVQLVVDDGLLAISNGPETGAHGARRRQGRGHASPRRCRCRPTSWRSWSARWRRPNRSTSTARRSASCTRPARGTSPGSGSTSVASRWRGSSSTTASPTRRTRSTSSPSPTSPPGRWRTSAASPSGRACSSSTRRPARRTSSSSWSTWSATSSPTCGSATSSRCAGGTASGSTRRSPRSWRCSPATSSDRSGSAGPPSHSSAASRSRPTRWPALDRSSSR